MLTINYSYWLLIFVFKRRFTCLLIIAFIVSLLSIIPLRLSIARYQYPEPQAILTLGGLHPREQLAAQLASQYPHLIIWVSSGSDDQITRKIFQDAGISSNRYHLDRRATDTVTNFTTLVEDFKKQDIKHLFLITSDFHLPRAKAIATLVLGSQGITFTPVSVPSQQPPEPQIKIIRDVARALIWILTKRTGSRFNQNVGLSPTL
jgi:uncharacterized SAM-binding protein YcdF (DUF218 family)